MNEELELLVQQLRDAGEPEAVIQSVTAQYQPTEEVVEEEFSLDYDTEDTDVQSLIDGGESDEVIKAYKDQKDAGLEGYRSLSPDDKNIQHTFGTLAAKRIDDDSSSIGDFFNDLGDYIGIGFEQKDLLDESLAILGGSINEEDHQEYIEAFNNQGKRPVPIEQVNFFKDLDECEKGGGGFGCYVKATYNNPSALFGVGVTSMIQMFNTPSLGAGATVLGTGAAIGAGGGSAAGPVGTLAGAAGGTVAAAPYAIATISATTEALASFNEKLTERLGGQPLTDEALKSAMRDPEFMGEARAYAAARGIAIGIFDLVTLKVGGSIAGGVARGTRRGSKFLAAGAGAGIEGLGGAGGEFAAQLTSGQEIKGSEIFVEGVAEIFGLGTISVAKSAFNQPTYKVNDSRQTQNGVKAFVEKSTVAEIQAANIQVSRDPKFQTEIENITSIKIVDETTDVRIKGEDRKRLVALEAALGGLKDSDTESAKLQKKVLRDAIQKINSKYIDGVEYVAPNDQKQVDPKLDAKITEYANKYTKTDRRANPNNARVAEQPEGSTTTSKQEKVSPSEPEVKLLSDIENINSKIDETTDPSQIEILKQEIVTKESQLNDLKSAEPIVPTKDKKVQQSDPFVKNIESRVNKTFGGKASIKFIPGEVLGAYGEVTEVDGKLNINIANSDKYGKPGVKVGTLLHEPTHVLYQIADNSKDKKLTDIVSKIDTEIVNTPEYQEVLNDPKYSGKLTEKGLAQEAFARYASKRGSSSTGDGTFAKLGQAIKQLVDYVNKKFGVNLDPQKLSLDDISDIFNADLLGDSPILFDIKNEDVITAFKESKEKSTKKPKVKVNAKTTESSLNKFIDQEYAKRKEGIENSALFEQSLYKETTADFIFDLLDDESLKNKYKKSTPVSAPAEKQSKALVARNKAALKELDAIEEVFRAHKPRPGKKILRKNGGLSREGLAGQIERGSSSRVSAEATALALHNFEVSTEEEKIAGENDSTVLIQKISSDIGRHIVKASAGQLGLREDVDALTDEKKRQLFDEVGGDFAMLLFKPDSKGNQIARLDRIAQESTGPLQDSYMDFVRVVDRERFNNLVISGSLVKDERAKAAKEKSNNKDGINAGEEIENDSTQPLLKGPGKPFTVKNQDKGPLGAPLVANKSKDAPTQPKEVIDRINKYDNTPRVVDQDMLNLIKKDDVQKVILEEINADPDEKSREAKLRQFFGLINQGDGVADNTFYQRHNLDNRGRIYTLTSFLKRQGLKVARGIVHSKNKRVWGVGGFADAVVQLVDLSGEKLQGRKDRLEWGLENLDTLLDLYNSPEANIAKIYGKSGELSIQAIHTAREISNAIHNETGPSNYEGSLLIGSDASQSGLQEINGFVRDKKGAEKVNISNINSIEDTYLEGAAETLKVYKRLIKENGLDQVDLNKEFKKHSALTKEIIEAEAYVEKNKKKKAALRKKSEGYLHKVENKNKAEIKQASLILFGGEKLTGAKFVRELFKTPVMVIFYSAQPGTVAKYIYNALKNDPDFKGKITELYAKEFAYQIFSSLDEVHPGAMKFMKTWKKIGKEIGNENRPIRFKMDSGFITNSEARYPKTDRFEFFYPGDLKDLRVSEDDKIKNNNAVTYTFSIGDEDTFQSKKMGRKAAPDVVHSADKERVHKAIDKFEDGDYNHDDFEFLAGESENGRQFLNDHYADTYIKRETPLLKDILRQVFPDDPKKADKYFDFMDVGTLTDLKGKEFYNQYGWGSGEGKKDSSEYGGVFQERFEDEKVKKKRIKAIQGKVISLLKYKDAKYKSRSYIEQPKLDLRAREILGRLEKEFKANKEDLTINQLITFSLKVSAAIRDGRTAQKDLRSKVDIERSEAKTAGKELADIVIGEDTEDISLRKLNALQKERNSWVGQYRQKGALGLAADFTVSSAADNIFGLSYRLLPKKGKLRARALSILEDNVFNPHKKAERLHPEIAGTLIKSYENLGKKTKVKRSKLITKSKVVVEGIPLTNNQVVAAYILAKNPNSYSKLKGLRLSIDRIKEIKSAVESDSDLRKFADGLTDVFHPAVEFVNQKYESQGKTRISLSKIVDGAQIDGLTEQESNEAYEISKEINGGTLPDTAPFLPIFKGTDSQFSSLKEYSPVSPDDEISSYYEGSVEELSKLSEINEKTFEDLDIGGLINTFGDGPVRSAAYLDFTKSSSAFFSEKNMKSFGAQLGENWRSDMANSIYRATTGRVNTGDMSAPVKAWHRFLKGSAGTIMAFNTKSGLGQLISIMNYSLGNPVAYFTQAGRTLSSEGFKEYKEAARLILDHGFLTLRKSGGTDTLIKELFDTKDLGSFNKAVYLLGQKGYIITKTFDAGAIIGGGSVHLAERLKHYRANGLKGQEAIDAATTDFIDKTSEAQQSTTHGRLGRDQTTTTGKYLTSFRLSTIQFNQKISKSLRNLQAGKDIATNTYDISYLLTMQYGLFAAFASGMWTLWDDEDWSEEDEKKKDDYFSGLGSTFMASRGVKGTMASVLIQLWNKHDRIYDQDEGEFKYGAGDELKKVLTGTQPYVGNKLNLGAAAFKSPYRMSDGFVDPSSIAIQGAAGLEFFGLPARRLIKLQAAISDVGSEDLSWTQKLFRVTHSRYLLDESLGKFDKDKGFGKFKKSKSKKFNKFNK